MGPETAVLRPDTVSSVSGVSTKSSNLSKSQLSIPWEHAILDDGEEGFNTFVSAVNELRYLHTARLAGTHGTSAPTEKISRALDRVYYPSEYRELMAFKERKSETTKKESESCARKLGRYGSRLSKRPYFQNGDGKRDFDRYSTIANSLLAPASDKTSRDTMRTTLRDWKQETKDAKRRALERKRSSSSSLQSDRGSTETKRNTASTASVPKKSSGGSWFSWLSLGGKKEPPTEPGDK